jgi:hypothetical protein
VAAGITTRNKNLLLSSEKEAKRLLFPAAASIRAGLLSRIVVQAKK